MEGFSRNINFRHFPERFGKSSSKLVDLYGKGKCSFYLTADRGMNASNDLEAINSWSDLVNGVNFFQPNAANQPRLRTADPIFNGRKVVEFNINSSAGRWMDSNSFVAIGPLKTVAFVYQYLTFGDGTAHNNSSIVRNNIYASQRSNGNNFGSRATNSSVVRPYVGYYSGSQLDFGSSSLTVYNFNPIIIVLNRDAIIVNGVSLTPETMNGFFYNSFLANVIGGITWSWSGAFKLVEWAVWEQIYSLPECLEICDEINNKYAIY